MKSIITNNGKEVFIDDVDEYLNLSEYNWAATEFNGCWYATASINQRTVYMHRMIMGEPNGMYIDHINRNGLDNRRENLRITTQSTNIANAGMFSHNTTGFKGVIFWRNKWHAQIKYKRCNTCSGGINDPVAAALVRDELARRLFGEPTFINLPDRALPDEYKGMVETLIASAIRRSSLN